MLRLVPRIGVVVDPAWRRRRDLRSPVPAFARIAEVGRLCGPPQRRFRHLRSCIIDGVLGPRLFLAQAGAAEHAA